MLEEAKISPQEKELKDLVFQTLEVKGVLGQIRAQLRSAVYSAIDQQDNNSSLNPISKIFDTPESKLAINVIREFMEFFQLRHSLATFTAECQLKDSFITKDELKSQLKLGRDYKEDQSMLECVLLRDIPAKEAIRNAGNPVEVNSKTDINTSEIRSPEVLNQQQPLNTSKNYNRNIESEDCQLRVFNKVSSKVSNHSESEEDEEARISSLDAKLKEMEAEDNTLQDLKATLKKELEEDGADEEESDNDKNEQTYGSDFEDDFEEDIESDIPDDDEMQSCDKLSASEEFYSKTNAVKNDKSAESLSESDKQVKDENALNSYDYVEIVEKVT